MNFKDDNYPTKTYSDKIAAKIRARLDTLVGEFKRSTCVCCGAPLNFDYIDMYDHEGGWGITPEIPKQWLSVHCDNCNYDISLTKLGVGR